MAASEGKMRGPAFRIHYSQQFLIFLFSPEGALCMIKASRSGWLVNLFP